MAVDRFLGAGWAQAHGPAGADRIGKWTLDCGFRGLVAAPLPGAPAWAAVRQAAVDLPFRFGAVRVTALSGGGGPAEAGLASSEAADQAAAYAAVESAVRLAHAVGCPRVILEPGVVPQVDGAETELTSPVGMSEERAAALLARRNAGLDRALDRVCRLLHALCRTHPEIRFCLTNSRDALGIGDQDGLPALFEDLSRCGLGYWHDAVAGAARQHWLGQEPGQVLESCSKFLCGMTLGDYCEGRKDLPPGVGGVDYPLLSAYRVRSGRSFPVAVELDPGVEPGEIPRVHAFLSKFDL
ncbi:MAG: hypothetical protein H6836_07555 [Planctomycetes bacterium]|nr:hypothetical protein [Planctomycetota bacterium]